MRRSRNQNTTSHLSYLHHAELGNPLPSQLLWRLQLSTLTHLHPSSSPLSPTPFGAPTSPTFYNRYPHMASIVPSPDKFLLCLATNQSQLEVHEPVFDASNSLRLNLKPVDRMAAGSESAWLKLAGLEWISPKGTESLIMAFQNRGEAWLFDLQRGSTSKPTSRFDLKNPEKISMVKTGARDICTVDQETFMVGLGVGVVRVFDCRVGYKPVGSIWTGLHDMSMVASGVYMYAAGGKEIAIWDRRVMESGIGNGSRGVKAFGKKIAGRNEEIGRKRTEGPGSVGWLGLVPGAVPGCIAYQTMAGGVGWIDLVEGGGGGFVSEQDGLIADTDLQLISVLGGMASYLRTGQCDIVRGPGGRGWVVVAPNIKGPGVRMVGFDFREDGEGESVDIVCDGLWTCVYAIGGCLERFILAGMRNKVVTVDIDLSLQKLKEDS